MKKYLPVLAVAILLLGLEASYSQMPPMLQFSGSMTKLLGDNLAFSATMDMQTSDKSGKSISMPGKFSFDGGKTRFELDMADMKGGGMSPAAITQMQSMGLDKMITIARPDKKAAYMIYPGMQSYFETHLSDADTGTNSNLNVVTTEIGNETVDGHPCVKNKVTVTDKKGKPHESIVWNAKDMDNFPIKIQTNEDGHNSTMAFKNISRAKPDAGAFEVPAGYEHYDDMRTMMQQVMMKKMGGNFGRPPSN